MTEKALVEGETEVLPAIADNTLIELAEQAEKRVQAMMKIKRMALKLTNVHDWVDENGKPYLQASGGERSLGYSESLGASRNPKGRT